MHHLYRVGLRNEILFVDTGYHFHETLRLRDEFIRRYGLNIVTLYPELTPEQQEATYEKKLHLYVDGQEVCCHSRKTSPYVDHMRRRGRQLSMVGVRRDERGRRDGLDILARDPRTQGYVLHPIYDWTSGEIEAYLAEHDVPVHPLHDQGYPSIGCACCTTPVEPGEDPRAGRWRHLRETGGEGPQYCGIVLTDGAGI
jgi:phosphoadenosine phosphosulfate reductase